MIPCYIKTKKTNEKETTATTTTTNLQQLTSVLKVS
jgi:hypothetical protein